jgi:hypothetical protein
MSSKKINTALGAIAELNTEIGDRIEMVPVSSGTSYPHVSFEYQGDDPVMDMSGIASITRQDWLVYVTAKTFTAAERIKNLLIGHFSGQQVDFYSRFNGVEYEFDPEKETHQFSLSYRITY